MNIKPVPVELVAQAILRNVNPLYTLLQIAWDLPPHVLLDVHNRIGDWLASGGKETDPFVRQQVAYAKKVYAALRGGE